MNKIWIWVLVVVIILGGVWYFMSEDKAQAPEGSGEVSNTMPVPGSNVPEMVVEPGASNIAPGEPNSSAPSVREFTVVGTPFAFAPNIITVNKGDTVRIVFQNKEGFHDWVIDEFGARTKQIKAGATETIEFVADKAGTFEYYCSVGAHRAQGMKGTLVVQ